MSRISVLALSADAYQRLRNFVAWVDLTPAGIEISDRTWDRVHELMGEPFATQLPEDVEVANVEIGSVDPEQAGDALIAVLCNDEGDEWRVLVTCNQENDDDQA